MPSILCAGTWKATVTASNKHGESAESELSAEFTVGVTSKPTINSVQVGGWKRCILCAGWCFPRGMLGVSKATAPLCCSGRQLWMITLS